MIFLAILYRKEEEKQILDIVKAGLSNAPNRFQYSLLEGFAENGIDKLTIINVLPVGTWPNNSRCFKLADKGWQFHHNDCYEVGCVNLPLIKQIQRELAVSRLLKRLTKDDKEVVIYSPYLPFLRAVLKQDPSVKVTLIVTDLPEFEDLGKTSALKKMLRKLNNKLIYKCLERVDRFVLLTEQMKDVLHVGDRPYIVVEGIADTAGELIPETTTENKKIIFYSGTLHEIFGIKKLIDGFSMLDDDEAELWLCGGGDAESYIKARAEEDRRIKFFGFVSTDKVRELRAQAAVLVNPRPNEGEYTKYSFPSKTMEYMASGIPTLMYKLDGVPDEYDPYLSYICGDRPEDIADALKKLLDMGHEERKVLGEKAREFVFQNKNKKIQAERILKVIRTEATDSCGQHS